MEGYAIDRTLLTSLDMQAILAGLQGLDSIGGTNRYTQLDGKALGRRFLCAFQLNFSIKVVCISPLQPTAGVFAGNHMGKTAGEANLAGCSHPAEFASPIFFTPRA